MTLDDIDLDQRIVWVLEGPPALLPIGRKTAQALDRYLRVREGHRLTHLPQVWVGRNGPMTPSGIYQVVHDRARVAGLPAMHPHQLRHAFATSWLAEGGNERADAGGWLEVTHHDRSLYQSHRGGACSGKPCPLIAGRPAIGSARLNGRDSCRTLAARVIAGRAPGVIIGHPADPRRSQPPAFARRRRGLGAVAGAQLGDR